MSDKKNVHDETPGEKEGEILLESKNIILTRDPNGIDASLNAFLYSTHLLVQISTADKQHLRGITKISEEMGTELLSNFFNDIKNGKIRFIIVRNQMRIINETGERVILHPQKISEQEREMKDLIISIVELKKENVELKKENVELKKEIKELKAGLLLEIKKEMKLVRSHAICYEEKPNGTSNPGTATNTWLIRKFTRIGLDSGIGVELQDGKIILPKGNYYIRASSSAFYCHRHRARIATSRGTFLLGTSEYSHQAPNHTSNRSHIVGAIEIQDGETIELQHYQNANNSNSFGVETSASFPELYAIIEIDRL